MKFFLPGVQTPDETAAVYQALKSSAQNIALSISDRKIYSLLFKRRGKLFSMKVGDPDPFKHEIVLVIFESPMYFLVFVQNRKEPYLIGKTEVLSMVEFE